MFDQLFGSGIYRKNEYRLKILRLKEFGRKGGDSAIFKWLPQMSGDTEGGFIECQI
jgi:hypothetical protein